MPTPSNPALSGLSQDFVDLLSALNARGAKYLLVGGYAVGFYSEPRATKDLDIYILSTEENSLSVFQALADFGAPLGDLSPSDFRDERSFFQVGHPPQRIDILQVLSDVSFEAAWETRRVVRVNDLLDVPLISPELLIQNKLAAGRPRDLLDVEEIRRAARLTRPR